MRRGTTLLELLVVMSLWSFIMVAVLGFYIYGTRVNQRYQKVSEEIRAVRQVAERFHTHLDNAQLLYVQQFPPTICFDRTEGDLPHIPGCLLANLSPQTEYIGIAPDPRRAPDKLTDPGHCRDNMLYLGRAGHSEVLMPLPTGLIAELRLKGNVLILSFNNPSQSVIPPETLAQDQYEKLESQRWQPMNHYFQFRGVGSWTQYQGN